MRLARNLIILDTEANETNKFKFLEYTKRLSIPIDAFKIFKLLQNNLR